MASAITVASPRGRAARMSITCWLVSAWAPVATSAVPATPIPPAKPTLARRGWRRGERDGHRLLADLLVDRLASGRQLLNRGLPAQVEATLAVDLDRLDHDLVAD